METFPKRKSEAGAGTALYNGEKRAFFNVLFLCEEIAWEAGRKRSTH